MTDCQNCGRHVDGLVCLYCRPCPKHPPIPPAAKARIDKILREIGRREGMKRDPDLEADAERDAIQGEGR